MHHRVLRGDEDRGRRGGRGPRDDNERRHEFYSDNRLRLFLHGAILFYRKMIEIINLCKSFNGHKVLDNLNLNINSGETAVIIGRSGCGKSVLLKHIIGLMKPESGQVLIDGKDVTKMDEKELNGLRMQFGMLFQGAALFDSLNVLENVGFNMIEHTTSSIEEIRSRVKECLA